MAFTGDILIHSNVWKSATAHAGGIGYDFAPMFADIAPLISSVDLGVCHLEVPVAPAGKEPSTAPLYGAPVEIVDGIAAAGYDRCSTASNHTLDQGVAGIEATLDAFEARGLGQSGMARTPDEIKPKITVVNGVKITHLSYTFGYNGLRVPNGEGWRSATIDAERIIEDAALARYLGAQVVIVSMHWGVEPESRVNGSQRKMADKLTASGLINVIVGHHAHVVQAIEQVNGVWTVFGLGNILSDHPTRKFFPPSSQDGMVVTVEVVVDPDGTVSVEQPVVHPTWVDRDRGYVIRNVLLELARADLAPEERTLYEQSLARTGEQVGDFVAQG